jgi:hypothetical protein
MLAQIRYGSLVAQFGGFHEGQLSPECGALHCTGPFGLRVCVKHYDGCVALINGQADFGSVPDKNNVFVKYQSSRRII